MISTSPSSTTKKSYDWSPGWNRTSPTSTGRSSPNGRELGQLGRTERGGAVPGVGLVAHRSQATEARFVPRSGPAHPMRCGMVVSGSTSVRALVRPPGL